MQAKLILLFILIPGVLFAVIHMEAIYPPEFSHILMAENGILVSSTSTTFTSQSVKIYNAANPAALELLSSFNVSAERPPKLANSRLYFPSPDKIICYSIADPANPVLIFQYNYNMAGGHYREMAISGDYLYLATQGLGLRVVYLANPTSATEIGHLTDENPFFWVWADGDRAVVLSYNLSTDVGILRLIDVSNPVNPVFTANLNVEYDYPEILSIQFYQNYMYLTTESGYTRIYDVSDMTNPQLLMEQNNWDFSNQVIKDGIRYCTLDGFFHIQNLDNPSAPQDIATYELPEYSNSSFVVDLPNVYFNSDEFWDNYINRFCLDVSDIGPALGVVYTFATGVTGYTEIDVYQNYLYYRNTIAEPTPSNGIIGTTVCPELSNLTHFEIEHDMLYTISYPGNFKIFSLDSPQQPVLLSTTDISPIYDFSIFEEFTFSGSFDSLSCYNVTNPAQPVFQSGIVDYFRSFVYADSNFWGVSQNILSLYRFDASGQFELVNTFTLSEQMGWYVTGMVKLDDYLYICGSEGEIKVLCITDPMNPVNEGQVSLPMENDATSLNPIIFQDRYLILMTHNSNQIVFYDLINPILPRYMSHIKLNFEVTSLACINNRLYTVNNGTLYAMRIPTFTDVVDDHTNIPYRRMMNYPNPFNPSTMICFDLPIAGDVKLEIYNIRGQKVKSLLNEHMISGNHQILWNGTNDEGSTTASGIYFSRLSSGGKTTTSKMLLLK